jgi:hypothetical protein
MKSIAMWLLCLIFISNTYASSLGVVQMQGIDEFYSFENDFEGWTIHGTHLDPALSPPITRSQTIAKDGVTSLKFEANRKYLFESVWAEKAFDVEPNQVFQVSIDYTLATIDAPEGLSSYLITGVSPNSVQTFEELFPTFQGTARATKNPKGNYQLVDKAYNFTATSDEQGKLYVRLGVWAAVEHGEIYYFDSVHVQINRLANDCDYSSFETGTDGWTAQATDLDSGSSSTGWSVAPTQAFPQDGKYSLTLSVNSQNQKAKIWIVKSFPVERGKVYRVNINYAFAPREGAVESTLITGVVRNKPETADDLIPLYQGEARSPNFWGWQPREYSFKFKSKKSDFLHVVIGVAGKDKIQGTYYLDNICVSVTEKQ